MIFSRLIKYKVVEFNGGLAIINEHDNLTTPGAVPLIASDSETLCQYLDRYIWARENGKEMIAAHNEAMLGTKAIDAGHTNVDKVVHAFDSGTSLAKKH